MLQNFREMRMLQNWGVLAFVSSASPRDCAILSDALEPQRRAQGHVVVRLFATEVYVVEDVCVESRTDLETDAQILNFLKFGE